MLPPLSHFATAASKARKADALEEQDITNCNGDCNSKLVESLRAADHRSVCAAITAHHRSVCVVVVVT